ncbi:MAG TPA: hypothetical protein VKB38_24600 [Terracidiphilus sp.]|nr:hypothetical protein [Terracidiphilus sp.]
MRENRPTITLSQAGAILLLAAMSHAASAASPAACRKVVIEAQVSAGQEWKVPIGEDWLFRIVPIPPLQQGYSGWDLVVDRTQPAGFPDALYLATPPYNSINQREIGTTYGLRAQDAIGWNPRTFRFFTDPATFRNAQKIYDLAFVHPKDATNRTEANASAMLVKLAEHASQGELRILDARLIPGVADPAPFAQNWAAAAARTQHENVPSPAGNPTARGALNGMRFSLTLWLPGNWALPPGLHATVSACGL